MILNDCFKLTGTEPTDKRRRSLELLLPSSPLVCVEREILGPAPKTLESKMLILVLMSRYLKLTSALLTSKMTVLHTVSLIMNNWMPLWGIPTYVMAYEEAYFYKEVPLNTVPI